ncbi:MAG: SDR family NAD(P)-dependent oxidoreductase, partial [Acidiferrobacteraceae bacterium]|nr:SDR family NAD(P)-dependent oxidoreductase [Acidiferrobacteraceae bacterium]
MTPQNRIRNLFELEGKVALITGASKGIGEAMARGLAEFGAKVVVSSRKADAVELVAESFRADGLEASGIAANMGRIEDIEALVDQVVGVYGGLDILINNAATNPVYGPIQQTDERAFDKIIDVNLKGPFVLCNKAYPILKDRGGGAIIHISSIGGLTPEQGIGMYSVSKAALINLTKAMAQ